MAITSPTDFIEVVSIGSAQLFSFLGPGEERKFVLDMSTGGIRFFSMLIAVLLGASMIPTEIERRTIFVILSKPVSRTQFLFGKYLGALLTLLANMAVMAFLLLMVLLVKYRGYAVNPTLWKGLLLTFVEVSVLAAISTAVSTRASTAFNLVFSFFVYFTGQMGEVFKHLSDPSHVNLMAVRVLMGVIYNIVPHFENFDLRQPLLLDTPVPWLYIGKTIGQGAIYIAVMLMIAHVLFADREF